MRKVIVTLIVFVLLWGGWYVCYPYFLMWLEGFSFFSTLKDFASVSLSLPADIFHYMGAFLLQFYFSSLSGAAVHALIPIISVICLWAVTRRVFKDSDTLFWIPFVALPALVYVQLDDITLARTCAVMTVSFVLAVAVYAFTCFFKPSVNLPAFLHHRALLLVVPLVSVILSLVFIKRGPLDDFHEDIAHLTYMGEHDQWNDIIQSVSHRDALSNEYKRKYVLLALTQTDQLPEHAFEYGLSSSDDFIVKEIDGPWALQYNVQYYRMLGLYNGVIYNAYQQSLQSLPGICNDAVRTLADTYIELGNYDLAKKYVDILDHSLCKRRWVNQRQDKLEAIRNIEPDYTVSGSPFVLQDFYKDISALVTRYPDERKYADMLLCALLADRDGNTFISVFDRVYESHYRHAGVIPKVYQEALCMVASHEPEILDRYKVDESIWNRYADFVTMMNQGKPGMVKRKYADTYWVYAQK